MFYFVHELSDYPIPLEICRKTKPVKQGITVSYFSKIAYSHCEDGIQIKDESLPEKFKQLVLYTYSDAHINCTKIFFV